MSNDSITLSSNLAYTALQKSPYANVQPITTVPHAQQPDPHVLEKKKSFPILPVLLGGFVALGGAFIWWKNRNKVIEATQPLVEDLQKNVTPSKASSSISSNSRYPNDQKSVVSLFTCDEASAFASYRQANKATDHEILNPLKAKDLYEIKKELNNGAHGHTSLAIGTDEKGHSYVALGARSHRKLKVKNWDKTERIYNVFFLSNSSQDLLETQRDAILAYLQNKKNPDNYYLDDTVTFKSDSPHFDAKLFYERLKELADAYRKDHSPQEIEQKIQDVQNRGTLL